MYLAAERITSWIKILLLTLSAAALPVHVTHADTPKVVLDSGGQIHEAAAFFSVCANRDGVSDQEYLDWTYLQTRSEDILLELDALFNESFFLAHLNVLEHLKEDRQAKQELLSERNCDRASLREGREWVQNAQSWINVLGNL